MALSSVLSVHWLGGLLNFLKALNSLAWIAKSSAELCKKQKCLFVKEEDSEISSVRKLLVQFKQYLQTNTAANKIIGSKIVMRHFCMVQY